MIIKNFYNFTIRWCMRVNTEILQKRFQSDSKAIQNYKGVAQFGDYSKRVFPKYAEGTQPFTVLIEGNIGSGKTTFLNHFQKYEDICLLTEPVDKWRNCADVNLLDLMYKEPHRWAHPFQTYVALTMLQLHTMPTDKSVKILERSIFSARYCFVENLYKNGTIAAGMYKILNEWYDFINKAFHIQADLIVYLRTSPAVVYDRIKCRARSEENCIPLQYLQELHELHENWLTHKNCTSSVPVLVLDANLDLDAISNEYKKSEDSIFKACSTNFGFRSLKTEA